MKMLRYAFVFSFFAVSLFAQTEQRITVGTQPTLLAKNNNFLMVLSAGHDKNFNGIFESDSGDVSGSISFLDTNDLSEKSRQELFDILPFAPYRPDFSALIPLFYKRNELFSGASFEPALPDSLGNIYGLASTENKLYISFRSSDFIKPGYIGEAELLSTATIKFSLQRLLPGGINPQQILNLGMIDGKQNLAVLNEGNFGQENSSIEILRFNNDNFSSSVIELGSGANHMVKSGDSIFVVMNASHMVQIVNIGDLTKPETVKSIPTKTSGFNGPREALIHEGFLYVSTYEGDVRKFDISSGELVQTFATTGKAEALAIVNGKLVVTNSLKKDYTPDNAISVFDLTTGVEENFSSVNISVYPNPVSERAVLKASIPHFEGKVSVEIFSQLGEKISSYSVYTHENFSLALPVAEFTNGQYFARISGGEFSRAVPFVVSK